MKTEKTATNEVVTDGIQAIAIKAGSKFGEWRVVGKIDEGGFGQVYRVQSTKNKDKFAALKVEPNDVEGGSAIKLEIAVLLMLNKSGEKPHIPVVYHSAKRKKFCYMVMTLLGPNLKSLKSELPKDVFSPSTWSRLGIQCLYALKLLHDMGFVHRDVKPANFVMGHQNDGERFRLVHLLDFGLARSFASEISKGKFELRKARGTAEFRGTARYCSPSVHERYEQGRKDDIWSLLYVLIEFNFGLPWQKERDRTKLEIRKLNISDDLLTKNFPEETKPIVPHLRSLNMYNRPDYSMIHKCLLNLMEKENAKFSDKYDWETDEVLEKWRAANTKPAAYENAASFFALDPIGVNEPPAMTVTASNTSTTTKDDKNVSKE